MAVKPPILLAGDVGGTKTNLALFSHRDKGGLKLLRSKRYPSADFESLNVIVAKFLHGEEEPVVAACFGVPGPVRNNRSQPTNLKWDVDGALLGSDIGTKAVTLLNDLAANAYGIAELQKTDFETLQTGLVSAVGNRCVVSPGTGLGEAGLYWDGHRHRVWACEGGHTDFAPRSEIEVEMLEYLQGRFGHVSVERVVSGQGISNIYAFLRDSEHGKEKPEVAEALKAEDHGKVITRFAEEGTCKMCSQAVEIFARCLAMEAGNMALKAMATGGCLPWGRHPGEIALEAQKQVIYRRL